MAIVDIKGKLVEFPDDLTPDQLQAAVSSAVQQIDAPPQIQKPSMIGKAWNALSIPEQKSREGLQIIANASQNQQGITGNLPRDIAMNAGPIMMDTIAEAAPGFVSRGAIVTAGALKGIKVAAPAIKAVGRGIARGAESISGLEYKTPGVLQEAASNPKLIFSAGKKAAEYEAAKKIGGQMGGLEGISDKKQLVETALKMAKKGQLNPTQALEARKELSAIKKSVSGEFYRTTTQKFNEVAKPVFGEADKAFQQGIKADALRMLLPVNKSGGTSIAKSAVATLLGPLGAAAVSPVVQGATASGIGVAAKIASPIIKNPKIGAVVAGVTKIVKDIKTKPVLGKPSGPDISNTEAEKKDVGENDLKISKPVQMKKRLDKDKARNYLKQAKNDRQKARQLAKNDGYEIPAYA